MKHNNQVNNILSDKYHMTGSDYTGASEAFKQIEKATYSIEADLSLVSVLSVVGKTDKLQQAVILDGNDQLVIQGCQVCLKDASFINIKGDADGTDDDGLFFQFGGAYKTPVAISDEDLFAVSETMIKPLARHLKIEHKQSRGFFRDADIAARFSSLKDEDLVHVLYREENNVKKAFSCFFKSDGMNYLRFRNLWETVCETAPGAEIIDWDITQYMRSITFLTDNERKMKIIWSDTGYIATTLEYEGNIVKIRQNEKLKTAIQNLLTMDENAVLYRIPVKELYAHNTAKCNRNKYKKLSWPNDPVVYLSRLQELDIGWNKTVSVSFDENVCYSTPSKIISFIKKDIQNNASAI